MNTSHVMEGRVSVWVDDRCLYPLYVQCVAVGCWRLTDCATLVTQSAVSTWPAVSCLTKMEGGREAMPSQSAHTDGTVPCHGWGGWMGGCTYTRKCPSRHAQCCKTIVSQTTRQADRQAQIKAIPQHTHNTRTHTHTMRSRYEGGFTQLLPSIHPAVGPLPPRQQASQCPSRMRANSSDPTDRQPSIHPYQHRQVGSGST
mmetsp:Transcript_7007/g.17030  ORF Transcript_7007/g.17030 Transcript_7007/m.17030 type:complete len:200 (+) Transcript_7007:887-1486(+)